MMLREWIVIVLVIGFLVSISLIAKFSEFSVRSVLIAEKSLESQMLCVTLSGAVKNPGAYPCKPGTTLKEILQKAGLSSMAERKKIQFKKVIYSSQNIEIPQKREGNFKAKKISFEEK